MLRLPFEIFLALRYLRPKRAFVSVITLISVLGVMLGVAVLIIVISVMTGFDKQLQERLLGFNAHMRIVQIDLGSGNPEPLADWQFLREVALEHPDVTGAAPLVHTKVMVETQPERGSTLIDAPFVRGIAPELEPEVSDLLNDVVWGEPDLSGQNMIVGIGFARNLGLRVGDRLAVYSHQSLRRMKESRGEEIMPAEEYLISGIFDAGMYDFNQDIVATRLDNAQDLLGLDELVHAVMIRVKDPLRVSPVRDTLSERLGAGFQIITWYEDSNEILTALQVEKSMMFYILFFIMIVAAFGIMNSQITFVVQKTREIGMLKALGTRRLSIVLLFLIQSFVVGLIGVGIGFGFGLLMLKYRNEFLAFMNKWTGLDLFPASIYQFTGLPAVIDSGDILLICGSALVICSFAGVIPAWMAARLRPVEALRNE